MPEIRVTKRFKRQRLRAPSRFKKGSLRTIRSGSHRIVIGRLKGMKVTTAQAILHPRSEKHSRTCPRCARLRQMMK